MLSFDNLSGGTETKHIDFDRPFDGVPTVMATAYTARTGDVFTSVTNVTAEGFDATIKRPDNGDTGAAWMAARFV